MRPPVILNVVFAVITYTWSCSTTAPSCACITGRIVVLPRASNSNLSRSESRCRTIIKAARHSAGKADSSSETASRSPAEEATATIGDVSITAHAAACSQRSPSRRLTLNPRGAKRDCRRSSCLCGCLRRANCGHWSSRARRGPSRDPSVRHSRGLLVPHSFQLAGEPLRSDWRRIVMHDCLPGRYALFRRVSTARYERALAPSSSLENPCANRLRTSASGAPVRSHNELIARSCLIASLPVSKSELIKTPTVKLTRMLRLSPAAGRRRDTLATLVHQTTHLDALVWRSVTCTAVRVEHPL